MVLKLRTAEKMKQLENKGKLKNICQRENEQ